MYSQHMGGGCSQTGAVRALCFVIKLVLDSSIWECFVLKAIITSEPVPVLAACKV